MSYIKFAVLLLQVVSAIIRMVSERRLIAEGERRVIAKELEAVARAAQISKQVHDEVARKTDAEIDDALRGDFRD